MLLKIVLAIVLTIAAVVLFRYEQSLYEQEDDDLESFTIELPEDLWSIYKVPHGLLWTLNSGVLNAPNIEDLKSVFDFILRLDLAYGDGGDAEAPSEELDALEDLLLSDQPPIALFLGRLQEEDGLCTYWAVVDPDTIHARLQQRQDDALSSWEYDMGYDPTWERVGQLLHLAQRGDAERGEPDEA